ncbi:hypothetical protein [Falsiphaeobacter marinintestinus]|uniref:hypothetical protein n=1 Tax=Falsiphaeobacter marinintestinus TaxID=1492905 RepID=UPI001FE7D542|nr:hypothetical protein [Phaeobacter marinintestinus]
MVDVNNQDELKEWLEGLPAKARTSFAARAALRSLPATFAVRDQKFESVDTQGFVLACLRATLISGAAGTWPAPEMSEQIRSAADSAARSADSAALSAALSADSAARSADSAARSALSAALSAARSADSADSAAFSAAFSAARSADSAALSAAPEATMALFETALWAGDVPAVFRDAAQAFSDTAPGTPWAFWAEWYQGMLTGNPMDWALQREVALIPPEDWDQGPEHIAGVIRGIEAAFLVKKLPLAETLSVNPETGIFRTEASPLINPTFIGALIARVDDALEDCLLSNNGLLGRDRETRVLQRVSTRFANDPQRIEMDYTSVAVSLRRKIAPDGELAESDDNLALLEAVEDGVKGIRANHPDVAANRNMLAAQTFRDAAPKEKALLEEAMPVLIEISEGVLAEDFAADIPALINDALLPLPDGAPRLPGADPAVRTFNRVSKMALLFKKGAEVFDSPQVKTLRLVGLAGGGAVFFGKLVELGLRMFGVL